MQSTVKKDLVLVYHDDKATDVDFFKIHTAYALSLLQTINNCPGGTVIGLFGSWGTGKSTIIEILKTILSPGEDKSDNNNRNNGRNNSEAINAKNIPCPDLKYSTKVLWFDVWRFSNEPLYRWILLELERQLEEHKIEIKEEFKPSIRFHREIVHQTNDKVKVSAQKYKKYMFWTIIIFVLMFILVAASFGTDEIKEAIKDISNFAALWKNKALLATILIGTISSVGITITKMIVERMADIVFATVTTKTIDSPYQRPEQFVKLFNELIDHAAQKEKLKNEAKEVRFVLCFDNLDRATSETAVEILSTIKTFLDNNNCIYLIPCDEKALVSQVHKAYGSDDAALEDKGVSNSEYDDDINFGKDFLQKFFQISLRLPPLLPFDMQRYLDSLLKTSGLDYLLGSDKDLKNRVKDTIYLGFYDQTPRKLKRLVNDVLAYLELSNALHKSQIKLFGDSDKESKIPLLTCIAVLHTRWPEFVDLIAKNPFLWQEIMSDLREFKNTSKLSDQFLISFLLSTITVYPPDDNISPYFFLQESNLIDKHTIQTALMDQTQNDLSGWEHIKAEDAIGYIESYMSSWSSSDRQMLLQNSTENILTWLNSKSLSAETEESLKHIIEIYALPKIFSKSNEDKLLILQNKSSLIKLFADYYTQNLDKRSLSKDLYGNWVVSIAEPLFLNSKNNEIIDKLDSLLNDLSPEAIAIIRTKVIQYLEDDDIYNRKSAVECLDNLIDKEYKIKKEAYKRNKEKSNEEWKKIESQIESDRSFYNTFFEKSNLLKIKITKALGDNYLEIPFLYEEKTLEQLKKLFVLLECEKLNECRQLLEQLTNYVLIKSPENKNWISAIKHIQELKLPIDPLEFEEAIKKSFETKDLLWWSYNLPIVINELNSSFGIRENSIKLFCRVILQSESNEVINALSSSGIENVIDKFCLSEPFIQSLGGISEKWELSDLTILYKLLPSEVFIDYERSVQIFKHNNQVALKAYWARIEDNLSKEKPSNEELGVYLDLVKNKSTIDDSESKVLLDPIFKILESDSESRSNLLYAKHQISADSNLKNTLLQTIVINPNYTILKFKELESVFHAGQLNEILEKLIEKLEKIDNPLEWRTIELLIENSDFLNADTKIFDKISDLILAEIEIFETPVQENVLGNLTGHLSKQKISQIAVRLMSKYHDYRTSDKKFDSIARSYIKTAQKFYSRADINSRAEINTMAKLMLKKASEEEEKNILSDLMNGFD